MLRLCWSCDPNHLGNFSFIKTLAAYMKFCFNQLSQWFQSFQRRSRLNCWRKDGACLYYMLPRAFGSGELKVENSSFCELPVVYNNTFRRMYVQHYINARGPKVARTQTASFVARLDEVQKSLCTTPVSASASASTFTLKFLMAYIFQII